MATARRRGSGVLLHVTSLPGGHGIGDMGEAAYRFVDWLADAGQSVWQVLPLGPPGFGGSPYASSSAFAGSPWLISLDALGDTGLLDGADPPGGLGSGAVDLPAVQRFKARALARAFERFQPGDEYHAFCAAAAYWLDDFARVRADQGADPQEERFVQFLFERQWLALRRYANERGIRILGDVPIFVAEGSVDVRAHPELFQLDAAGKPITVAGVPPDLFSATGQRWGNPLYRWEVMARDGYAWWRDRLRRMLDLVDLVRIDHFRGLAAYWAVPASERTAERGQWQPGPGVELFRALSRQLGELPIVVEDLGLITPDVIALRDELGYPGMSVLQFAFGDTPQNPYLPHNAQPNRVIYTGTHDNQTTRGWYESASEALRHSLRSYLGNDGHDIAWALIRLAEASVADTAIIPVQDLLSLGDEARLNSPGQASGNWAWRLAANALTPELAHRLRELTETYGRLPTPDVAPPGYPDSYPR